MNKRKQQGFTIIEVVLVLAIAGLIFLMVFIALPALQSGQRDTQRRNDVSKFKAQVNQFQANNKGVVPTVAVVNAGFKTGYLYNPGATAADPQGWLDPRSGAEYTYVAFGTDANPIPAVPAPTPGTWTYNTNKRCVGETTTNVLPVAPATPRTYAIVMKLEGAGTICTDNQ